MSDINIDEMYVFDNHENIINSFESYLYDRDHIFEFDEDEYIDNYFEDTYIDNNYSIN